MEWNEKKSAAVTKLTLRLAVAGYLSYLVWNILGGALDETSPIPPGLLYAICVVFILVAIGFAVYSIREFLRAIKAPTETPKDEENQDSESENDRN